MRARDDRSEQGPQAKVRKGEMSQLQSSSGVEELNPPPGKKWAKVADENVRHIWVCTDCKAKTKAIITPNWYENNGTPVCSCCDRDMTYSHTDWRYSDSKV